MTARRRILVVDDNVDAATLLGDALALAGHEVLVAHDGPAAIRLASKAPPHVVLLDLGMPQMTGYEVATCLQDLHPHAEMRIVAVTGYGQESAVKETTRRGFFAHLVKPVEMAEILRLLE